MNESWNRWDLIAPLSRNNTVVAFCCAGFVRKEHTELVIVLPDTLDVAYAQQVW